MQNCVCSLLGHCRSKKKKKQKRIRFYFFQHFCARRLNSSLSTSELIVFALSSAMGAKLKMSIEKREDTTILFRTVINWACEFSFSLTTLTPPFIYFYFWSSEIWNENLHSVQLNSFTESVAFSWRGKGTFGLSLKWFPSAPSSMWWQTYGF